MPDFDVDFDERRRGEVIRYVTEKYGEERVAQIVTYGTIKAKQAVKDAARVMGHPFAMGEKLTKAMPPPIMGKDMPLAGVFDQNHPRYHEAAEFRSVRDEDPQAKEVVDDRARAGGPEAPVGRPRRRRDHEQRAAHRPHPDHAPRAGRPDHHPVRLPELRDARAGQDGLPRPAQPHHPRRRPRQRPRQPRRGRRPRGPVQGHDRPRGLRGCCSAATPWASSSSTAAACGPCCARCSRTRSRTSRPRIALYRPGPMGINSHTNYATARPASSRSAHPPRAGRAARGDPRGDLRPDRLPGAGDPASRRRWPATRSAGPTCCARRWARRRRRSSTPSSAASRRG